MPKKEYCWTVGEKPPLIDEHTKIKHKIYQDYIKQYIKTINKNPLIPNCRFVVVDAFAGGGLYCEKNNEEYFGSPIKIWQTIQDAEDEINEARNNKFVVNRKLFLLEKKDSNFKYLKKTLEEKGYGKHFDDSIILQKGSFVDKYKDIIGKIHKSFTKNTRVIFILDQYGYKDAPYDVIREIFQLLPKAEIILTLPVSEIIDYVPKNSDKKMNQLSLPNLQEEIKKINPNRKKSLNAVGLNEQQLQDIKTSNNKNIYRGIIEKLVTKKLVFYTQAKHFTPFFLNRKNSHRSIWLIHLTNHSEGVNVMKEIYFSYHNIDSIIISHYGGSGLDMLGYKHTNNAPLFNELPEYNFKNKSIESTNNKLLEQIPKEIHKQEISFYDFYKQQANGTPATKKMMRSACEDLLLTHKEIKVSNRSPRTSIKDSDIISNHPQKTIFLPNTKQ
ncbi:MAG: hypothetical protein DRQ51_07635 [Gammaproteobacteria bacterium]|nr:MAG: hypothetical protein DRQ51_07635 [Gammaproteobacteria bacterium]